MKPITEGKGGWAAKFWRRDYGAAIEDASRLRAVLGGRLIQRVRMGKGYLPLIQAQYVRAGMAVADAKGGYDIVREVELHDARIAHRLRPRHRGFAQLHCQRHLHAQLDLCVSRRQRRQHGGLRA